MNIGSLWAKETDIGKKYMSGSIQSPFLPEGEMRIAIFKNENKSSENAPDYFIVWNPKKKEKKEQTSGDSPLGSDADLPF